MSFVHYGDNPSIGDHIIHRTILLNLKYVLIEKPELQLFSHTLSVMTENLSRQETKAQNIP